MHIPNTYQLYIVIRHPTHFKHIQAGSKAGIENRQAILVPVLGAPFLASSLPLAAAGAIGVYGVYGDEIARLINSFLGKCKNN